MMMMMMIIIMIIIIMMIMMMMKVMMMIIIIMMLLVMMMMMMMMIIFNGTLKTEYWLESVPRCEPTTYELISPLTTAIRRTFAISSKKYLEGRK